MKNVHFYFLIDYFRIYNLSRLKFTCITLSLMYFGDSFGLCCHLIPISPLTPYFAIEKHPFMATPPKVAMSGVNSIPVPDIFKLISNVVIG